MHGRAGLVLALWLPLALIGGLAVRQAACGEPDRAARQAQPGPQRAEFDRLLAEWKDLLAELAILQVRYPRADDAERAKIRRQWDPLIKKGNALEPRLIKAAERAFLEAPNADKQVTDLLIEILAGHVQTRPLGPAMPGAVQYQTDNYEEARRLAKLLMAGGCKDARVYCAAGIAAFALQEFDDAEEYLKRAQKNRVPIRSGGKPLDDLLADFLNDPARYKKAWAKETEIRRAEAKADDLPRVLLKTTKGEIVLELFENQAPNTVANFISLVEKGFYDGLTFHRVLPGFMAQAGCPIGDGRGGPGYRIPCECYPPHHYRLHFRGSLSMAHHGVRDTGGSQFFLTFVPTSHLDGVHTVFGRVIKGFDVLHKLQRRDPERPRPPDPDRILQAEVLRKRNHDYVPTTWAEK